MKTTNIFKNNITKYSLIFIIGCIIGYIISQVFSNSENVSNQKTLTTQSTNNNQIWTCSMHPQIRQSQPGKCPICGMDLIPLQMNNNSNLEYNKIQMSESAIKLADIQTTKVQKSTPIKEIQLSGKIKVNEEKTAVITARFSGRIEKLFINYTGQTINKNEKLCIIYSPDLIKAQKELLEVISYKQSNPEYYKAIRNKLKLWSLTDEQINLIEQKSEVQNYFEILAPISGTVIKKNVVIGNYVNEGDVLFEIADLNNVWIELEAYEADLPWIKIGDNLQFEIQSLPGKKLDATISFIDPVINPETRTASIRAEIQNNNNLLKPEMFVKGKIKTHLPFSKDALIIPKSAVLWTGNKSVVYVKDQNADIPTFEYREIVLGEDAGNFYVVKEGLSENEEIVSNGVFKVDAAAQLQGKKSMMNSNTQNSQSNNITNHNHQLFSLNSNTQKILQSLLKDYIQLKDELVADNFEKSKMTSKVLLQDIKKINSSAFKGESKDLFLKFSKEVEERLKRMENAKDIESIRTDFIELSNQFIQFISQFEPLEQTIYIEYCPMANQNKGAEWISFESEIRNPYFGKSMLKCGKVVREIKK